MFLNLVLIFSVLNFLLFFYYKKISRIVKIYDVPDSDRKIHKGVVPVLGGTFLLINLILVVILYFYNFDYNEIFFNDNKVIFFFITILGFYLLGVLDDGFKVSANYKLIISICLLLFVFYFDNTIAIKSLRFSFLENEINIGKYSFFVSVLCYLLFINAFNMIDGINGQAAFYALFIFSILFFKGILTNFCLIIIIFLIFYLYFNLKGKIFFGDGGSLPLAFLLSYIMVKDYNLNQAFYADEIFLIMCIPGYDLLRLFVSRIIKKRHPFSADSSHIHHIFMNKLNFFNTMIIAQVLFVLPYASYLVFNVFYFSLFLSIALYVIAIYGFNRVKS
tara:strand:+ start:10626 stop:11624 length:999 start_codon:yes stop_codon:yes gene_type:complete